MDNPGTSLFQAGDININNRSQNIEEEEDLEDQLRRREELQNLLTAALDDFNYDDSTINSSTNVSLVSEGDLKQAYKNSSTSNDQLKVLYDVRVREINNLKEEYEKYRSESSKELESVKQKLFLYEAENRQLKISLKNSETLLVERSEVIKKLENELDNRGVQIKKYERTIEEYEIKVATYQSQLNELHLKLQTFNGPFNLNAKFNSEELHNSYTAKITQLESELEQERSKTRILETEHKSLRNELDLVLSEKHDLENNIVENLSKNLESAQQQCKDLIDIVDMLQRENKHFKERFKEYEENVLDNLDISKLYSWDVATLAGHIEKLKKMLLDKSIEFDTLKSKLKSYEADLKELFEYRQLKCDIYKKEFQQCNNQTHTKDLLLMQNDIHNHKQTIEDKNAQINNLNTINKELQSKIEDMLVQTRTEIQKLSEKYNVPQLEMMSKELRNAENVIKELNNKLQKSEERRLSVLNRYELNNQEEEMLKNELYKINSQLEIEKSTTQKLLTQIKDLQNRIHEISEENNNLKLNFNKNEISDDYNQLKDHLKTAINQLEKNKNDKESPEVINIIKNKLKNILETNAVENENIKSAILECRNDLDKILVDKHLKKQYKEAINKLHDTENKLKELQQTVVDITKAKSESESDKCTLVSHIKDYKSKLEQYNKVISSFKKEIINLNNIIKEKDCTNKVMNQQIEDMSKDNAELNEKLINLESELKLSEERQSDSNKLLMQLESTLKKEKEVNLKLQKEINEMNDKNLKNHLEKRLRENEDYLEHSANNETLNSSEHLKNELQVELVKCELRLRDEIQIEYQKRINDIEKRYQMACKDTNELNKIHAENLKTQENKYRGHLKMILNACAKREKELEMEIEESMKHIQALRAEFSSFRSLAITNENKYVELIKQMEIEAEKNVNSWKKWARQYVTDCLHIEAKSKACREKILQKMKVADDEVTDIEKKYNSKIMKFVQKNRLSSVK